MASALRLCTVLGMLLSAVAADGQATLTITPAKQYQTIEGFGGFGPMKVWWSGDNETYYTDA